MVSETTAMIQESMRKGAMCHVVDRHYLLVRGEEQPPLRMLAFACGLISSN